MCPEGGVMGDPQQFFAVGVGVHNAAMAHQPGEFALEQRHPDGERWIVLARFATKRDARAALADAVDRGANADDLRVEKVASPPTT
jgi:hypothetical protein